MPRKMNWALQRRTQAVGDLSMKSGRSRYDDDDKMSAAVTACLLLLLSPMLADDDDDGTAMEGLSKDLFPESRAAGGSVRGCSAEGCSVAAGLLSFVVVVSFFFGWLAFLGGGSGIKPFRSWRPRWSLPDIYFWTVKKKERVPSCEEDGDEGVGPVRLTNVVPSWRLV